MISIKVLAFCYLFIAIILFGLKEIGLIRSRGMTILIMLVCPLVGEAIFIVSEIMIRKELDGINQKSVKILKSKDTKNKEIRHKKAKDDEITVPLEEALLINDTKTRRNLMLGILRRNPDEYFSILKKAQISDDVEIAHYATSTMMGIQSEYETKLRVLREKYMMDPTNKSIMDSYILLLDKYIESGLLQGKALERKRTELDIVLNSNVSPNITKHYVYMNISNKLELKSYDNIEDILSEAKKKWEDDEKIYMFYIDYYRDRNLGYKIRDVIKEIDEKEVYLTHSGKQWYSFWNGGCVI